MWRSKASGTCSYFIGCRWERWESLGTHSSQVLWNISPQKCFAPGSFSVLSTQKLYIARRWTAHHSKVFHFSEALCGRRNIRHCWIFGRRRYKRWSYYLDNRPCNGNKNHTFKYNDGLSWGKAVRRALPTSNLQCGIPTWMSKDRYVHLPAGDRSLAYSCFWEQ